MAKLARLIHLLFLVPVAATWYHVSEVAQAYSEIRPLNSRRSFVEEWVDGIDGTRTLSSVALQLVLLFLVAAIFSALVQYLADKELERQEAFERDRQIEILDTLTLIADRVEQLHVLQVETVRKQIENQDDLLDSLSASSGSLRNLEKIFKQSYIDLRRIATAEPNQVDL